MAPRKAAPPSELENFHNTKAATVRLGLATDDPEDKRGQKWLRDGVNRPADGSKGPKFPCRRMAGQLMFSDSDLAEIAEICHNALDRRGHHPRMRQTRKPAVRKSPVRAMPDASGQSAA